jgi:hypothetical protein
MDDVIDLGVSDIRYWTPKNGARVPTDKLDDKYVMEIGLALQRLAEIKRRAIVAVYQECRDVAEHHARMMAEMFSHYPGRLFTAGVLVGVEEELKRRGLKIPETASLEEDLEIPLTQRGSLERQVVGAIRDCVNAHGPITRESAPSAAKRVIGAIRYHNRKTYGKDRTV